jgi:hypothetical protein
MRNLESPPTLFAVGARGAAARGGWLLALSARFGKEGKAMPKMPAPTGNGSKSVPVSTKVPKKKP